MHCGAGACWLLSVGPVARTPGGPPPPLSPALGRTHRGPAGLAGRKAAGALPRYRRAAACCVSRWNQRLSDTVLHANGVNPALPRRTGTLGGGEPTRPSAQVEQPLHRWAQAPQFRQAGRGECQSAARNPGSRRLRRGGGSGGLDFPRALGPDCVCVSDSGCPCSPSVHDTMGSRVPWEGMATSRPLCLPLHSWRFPTPHFSHPGGSQECPAQAASLSPTCSARRGHSPALRDSPDQKRSHKGDT